MNSLTEIIGIIAGLCTTISFIPQAIKVYKSKQTKDISLKMFILFTAGLIFWLIYGILLNSLPIILANSLTLFSAGYILIMKVRLG